MPTDTAAILLSAKVAVTATILALPLGFLFAYLMTFHRFRGKMFLDVLVNLPLALPPVVVGYFLLVLMGRKGWIGWFLEEIGIEVIFTWKAAAVASAVVGFPLLIRSIRIGMEGIDEKMIQASRTLGAKKYDALVTVILPLSFRGIVAGSFLMFARSLGEFGAIPLAIFDYASSPGGEKTALALCIVSVSFTLVILFFHEILAKRLVRRD